MNRDRFIAEVNRLVGTPYRHQGRSRCGVDCIGLIIVAAQAAGWTGTPPAADYSRQPSGRTFLAGLESHLVRVPMAEAVPGDVLFIRFRLHAGLSRVVSQPHHVAVLTAPSVVVHAASDVGRVVAQRMGSHWRDDPFRAYRFSEDEAWLS